MTVPCVCVCERECVCVIVCGVMRSLGADDQEAGLGRLTRSGMGTAERAAAAFGRRVGGACQWSRRGTEFY